MAGYNIDGTWRGHYTYIKLPDEGSGFDAIFTTSGGALTGSIRDDVPFGEASISGSFSYPAVSFRKVYMRQGMEPIDYRGRMSDDGKSMSGTWVINSQYGPTRGTWYAHRIDDGEEKREKEEKSKVRKADEILI